MSAEEEALRQRFPRLRGSAFQITSPQTSHYNCIAWAAEDQRTWWWPGGPYWPSDVQPDETLDAFIRAFTGLGYTPCQDGGIESGFQKIALYVDAGGSVTHAARQLPDGRWSSKHGKAWDIAHPVGGLEGSSYGCIAQFLKRPLGLSTKGVTGT